jgi:hypothetical protein
MVRQLWIVIGEVPEEIAVEIKLLKPASLTAASERRGSFIAAPAEDVAVIEEIDPRARQERTFPCSDYVSVKVGEIRHLGAHRGKEQITGTDAIALQARSTYSRCSLPENNRDDDHENQNSQAY